MKRTCTKCEEEKDDSDFYKNVNNIRSWCKKCFSGYCHERWKARKKLAFDLLGGCCADCGYNKNLAAIDFRHIDPETKEFNWGRLSKRPWDDVIKELKKCVALCRVCHAERHHPDMAVDMVDASAVRSLAGKPEVLAVVTGMCPVCGGEVCGTTYCSNSCRGKSQQRVARPPKDELSNEIATMSWLAMSRKYGVSDNAIRKWAKSYGLI